MNEKISQFNRMYKIISNALAPIDKGDYYTCICPRCKRKELFVYKDQMEKCGLFATMTCNRKNNCGFRSNIRNHFNIKAKRFAKGNFCELEQAFKSHDLNLCEFIENNILDKYARFKLGKAINGGTAFLELKKVDGKLRWQVNKKNAWKKKERPTYLNPLIRIGEVIYIFAGEWDYLKAFKDGLTCTTSIFGETVLPGKYDLDLFMSYQKIVICLDQDNAGKKATKKLGKYLKDEFPSKGIHVINLPFSKKESASGKKDYVDWRKKNTANEFLKLAMVEVKSTKQDCCWIEVNAHGKKMVNPNLAAEHFIDQQEGNLIRVKESFWYYQNGIWKRKKDYEIKSKVLRLVNQFPGIAKKTVIEDIFYQIKNNYRIVKENAFEFNNKANKFINFANGILNIETGELLNHSSDYYFTIQFNYDFDERATSSIWLSFLESLDLGYSTLKRIQEWFGYCLIPDTRIQKSLYLKGEGANGKSVILETLTALLGDATSSVEITDLFDKFKTSEIEGKLANICTDIRTAKIFDERFKKAVDGACLSVEKKHKDSYEFKSFCRFLFSANDYIPTKDKSHGFFRRFDLIEFKKIIPPEKQDKQLLEKLKKELPGIFNWAYEGLRRLQKNNYTMTICEDMSKTMQEFREHVNPLQQFINERCELEKEQEYKHEYTADKKVFRQTYVQWCNDNGYQPLAENNLGKEMKRLNFKEKRIGTHSKRTRAYCGLKILNNPFD